LTTADVVDRHADPHRPLTNSAKARTLREGVAYIDEVDRRLQLVSEFVQTLVLQSEMLRFA
jgi:hypothetical protein